MILPFNIEHQTQSNWCWAATSKSISNFYSILSSWTQCKIATSELSLSCCTLPVPRPCNVPWYLDRALTRTNNFVSYAAPVSWQRVLQDLQNGLVLGARVGWNGGGGHFMVIHGATTNGIVQYLHIDDPIHGKSVLPYNQFLSNYQGSGKWTHTYFTKKYSYFMWLKNTIYNERLLKPILDVKPHLKTVEGLEMGEFALSDQNENYDLPHYAYVLGLNEIKDNSSLPKEPSSLRIIEMGRQKPVALFEVTLDENNPELIQMNTNEKYFLQLERSLNIFRNNTENEKKSGELRVLKIPALNVEAFWIHYDMDMEGGSDRLLPIKKFDEDARFNWDNNYPEADFFGVLRSLAAEINQSDDLLGA